MTAANGVVIATEKKLPSILVDETSVSLILFLLFSQILWKLASTLYELGNLLSPFYTRHYSWAVFYS